MIQKTRKENTHLDSLSLLRGIAVTLVCLYHFTFIINGNVVYKWLHSYGHYGVQMFFVISGFVIPLSLYKGFYELNDYSKFIWKRFLRLQPPYLASLIVTLVLSYFAFRSRDQVFPETLLSVLKAAFYLHIPQDNQAYWTLAVEWQYYFLIGLLFLVLRKYAFIALPLLSITVFIPVVINNANSVWLISYLPVFFVGVIGYLLYTKQGNIKLNIASLIFVFAVILYKYEIAVFITSSITVAIIYFYRQPIPAVLQFPGKVSYSVYLLHLPVCMKFLNLSKRYVSGEYNMMLVICAYLLILLIAWGFYKILEEWSEKLSKKIYYSNKLKSNAMPQSI